MPISYRVVIDTDERDRAVDIVRALRSLLKVPRNKNTVRLERVTYNVATGNSTTTRERCDVEPAHPHRYEPYV